MDDRPFGAKLELALKALSMSRARLAADLAVDKSLVGRWVSGAVTPSAHNLARLTQFIAGRRPGFSLLDWDRDPEGLAQALGAERPEGRSDELVFSLPGAAAAAARARGGAYEGLWRHTRSAGIADRPDMFFRGYFLIKEGANGLLGFTGGLFEVRIEGGLVPVQNQLFGVSFDTVTGRATTVIFNGIAGPRAEVMDGIVLSCRLDMGGSPAAYRCVAERVADLTDDPQADARRLDALMMESPVVPDGSVPESIRSYLLRDCGLAAAAAGGDLVLMMPHLGSLARASAIDASG
jgi:transcriptional regulator with XRE-family HTH domain